MEREPQNKDTWLLLQVAKGDEKAFRELFDAYHNRLYFFVLSVNLSKEIAEDIVQDTFLKIWLRREQLHLIDNFNAYIFKMAQNAIASFLRRKALEAGILANKSDAAQDQRIALADEMLDSKLIKGVIQKAIDALPEQQQAVFRLRRQEGLKIKEVAALLGISEITVKRHLTEAQKTLRKKLESRFPFEGGALLTIFVLFENL